MSARGDIARMGGYPVTLATPTLVSRDLVAACARRHPDLVKRHCTPLACDVKSKRPLYDYDAAVATLNRCPKLDRSWREARRPPAGACAINL